MKKEIIEKIIKFRNDRNWKQFHTGENLAKALIIEAAELLEVFQWSQVEKNVEKIEEELADVLIYSALIADCYNLNIDDIVEKKLKQNELKYPIEKSKGNSKKYSEFK